MVATALRRNVISGLRFMRITLLPRKRVWGNHALPRALGSRWTLGQLVGRNRVASATAGSSLQAGARAVGPELQRLIELRPGRDRRRIRASAIDALREQRIRLGVADLAFDRRRVDELPQPGRERTVWTSRPRLANRGQDIERRIGRAHRGDRQTEPQGAARRLVDEPEPRAQ